ncbi:MAG: anti-sigma factor [Solirubrobacteraceae bacterium]
MSTPGPDHQSWSDAVGAYLLGALPPEERAGFESHLAGCPVCRSDVGDLQVAADALLVSVPLITPPAALKDRIMTVVRSDAELLAAAGERADRPAPAARVPGRPRRSFAAWFLRPGLALASVLVLVAGAGLAVVLSGGEDTRTVIASTQAPAAEVRLEIRDDHSTLVARNMPAPPSGRIYQVWLKRPDRAPAPTSVLWSTREDGSAEVAVPGSLEGVEAVLVTDEPEGGSQQPTKPPVITAPVV